MPCAKTTIKKLNGKEITGILHLNKEDVIIKEVEIFEGHYV